MILHVQHQRPDGDVDTYHLAPGRRYHIGRGSGCEVRILDLKLSRKHAAFEYSAGEWRVLDLGSTNGCSVDGEPIAGSAILTRGTRIALGTTTLTVAAILGEDEINDEELPPAPERVKRTSDSDSALEPIASAVAVVDSPEAARVASSTTSRAADKSTSTDKGAAKNSEKTLGKSASPGPAKPLNPAARMTPDPTPAAVTAIDPPAQVISDSSSDTIATMPPPERPRPAPATSPEANLTTRRRARAIQPVVIAGPAEDETVPTAPPLSVPVRTPVAVTPAATAAGETITSEPLSKSSIASIVNAETVTAPPPPPNLFRAAEMAETVTAPPATAPEPETLPTVPARPAPVPAPTPSSESSTLFITVLGRRVGPLTRTIARDLKARELKGTLTQADLDALPKA